MDEGAGVGEEAKPLANLGSSLQLEDELQEPLHVRPGAGARGSLGQRKVGGFPPLSQGYAGKQPVGGGAGRHPDEVAQQLPLQLRRVWRGRFGAFQAVKEIAATNGYGCADSRVAWHERAVLKSPGASRPFTR